MAAGAGTPTIRRSYQQRAAAALSFLILALGIVTIGIALYMVLVCYTSLPWSDGWAQIFVAASGQNPFSLRWLWEQHNEHRLLIPKLLLGLDLRFFAASQKLLLASIFLVQLLHCCLLSWSMRALGGWRGWMWLTGTGLAAFCLFAPTQWENFTWGFQTCFVLPPLFATLSFVGLLLYFRDWKTPQKSRPWKFVVLSVLTALAAVCCLANGLLLLPLLALAGVVLRLRPWVVLTYLAAAAFSTTLYFRNYLRPMQNTNPLVSLRAPGKLISYIATYFGSSWTVGGSWVHHNLQVAPYLGSLGLLTFAAYLLFHGSSAAPRCTFSVQLILTSIFCVATALLTALGRVASGNEQAFASRYQTIALLFWWSLGCLALASGARRKGAAMIAVQVLFAVALLRAAKLAHVPLRDAREHAFQQRAASAALVTGVDDREQIARASSYPDDVLGVIPFMREKHLSIFARGDNARLGLPIESVSRVVNEGECQGTLQSVITFENGELRITGWAWDRKGHRPTEMLVAANGRVVGTGAVGDWRPQLRADYRYINTSFIGFTAYAKVLPLKPVTVYAVIGGSTPQACEIGVTNLQRLTAAEAADQSRQ